MVPSPSRLPRLVMAPPTRPASRRLPTFPLVVAAAALAVLMLALVLTMISTERSSKSWTAALGLDSPRVREYTYQSYDEITRELQRLARLHPDIMQVRGG